MCNEYTQDQQPTTENQDEQAPEGSPLSPAEEQFLEELEEALDRADVASAEDDDTPAA